MKVTHFVRWLLPHTASFIRNQIFLHQRYSPSVVYAQKKEGPFFDEIAERFDMFSPLSTTLDHFLYNKTRLLSGSGKKNLKKFLRNQKSEIYHLHYGVDCLIYSDVIRDMGVPSCVSFYGYDCTSFPERFFGLGKKLLVRYVFMNPSIKIVFAMSEDMRNDLLSLGCPESKIIVHYYGTDTSKFYQEHERKIKDTVDLLIISGLYKKKGHLFLLEALCCLSPDTMKRVHLHIVGEGPMRGLIERFIDEKKVSNVTLHGSIVYGSDEHLNFLHKADIFVHPSVTSGNGDKEGIPGSIIEAMASGLPTISTYHAGIPSVIEDGRTGILVRESNIADLKLALESLISNHKLRSVIGAAGQKYAINQLDVQKKEEELEYFYDKIIT